MANSKSWVKEEFDSVNFGDSRLKDRCHKLLETMSSHPGESISRMSQNEHEAKANYRLIANNNFDIGEVMQSHTEKTKERIEKEEVVLAIQDTSYLNYDGHEKTVGLGHIATRGKYNVQGLLYHPQFIINTEGVPLGLLNQKIWSREKHEKVSRSEDWQRNNETKIEDKESYKWLDGINAVDDFSLKTRTVHVGDRESDFYFFHFYAQEKSREYVVRARYNRRIKGDKDFRLIEDKLASKEILYSTEVMVKNQKRIVDVKYCNVKIPKTKCTYLSVNSEWTFKDVTINVIEVKEKNPPHGKAPLHWTLITNIDIETKEEIQEKIKWYTLRWKIEEYFKVLKSVLKVENLRFSTADKIIKMVQMLGIVAYRIFHLTVMSRHEPDKKANCILSLHELEAIHLSLFHEKLKEIPSIQEAFINIARLGGYLNRKSDPPPGVIVMARGWEKLQILNEAYAMFKTYG